ncbi:MAG: methyltransferase domain-containing protein [bacterium]|nr:methyltransferase domain-containing protein [bacterium]
MGLQKKFISYFKTKVKNTIKESGYTVSYFPYDKSVNDYIITKSEKIYSRDESGMPVPPPLLRIGYADNDAEYLKSGVEDTGNMFAILDKAGFEITKGKKILDFGCSSGRMLRHFKKYADDNEIWGTDVSGDHIYWCNKYLNPPFQFLISTFNAHLPFEDRNFDLIYSGSVFTHIDNLIEPWLLEMKRILSPNGYLYITIHDNHTIELLNKEKVLSLGQYVNQHPMYEAAKKDFDFFVFNRAKSPQVFFDNDYFKKLIRSSFEIVSYNEEAYGYQTGVLLKRKS